jgi:hypothetical protein
MKDTGHVSWTDAWYSKRWKGLKNRCSTPTTLKSWLDWMNKTKTPTND